MYFDVEQVADRFPQSIFDALIGGTYDFYGVDGETLCIGVNGTRVALEAVEDPSDGYRSYFGCFRTSEVGHIFFGQPIARVALKPGGESSRSWNWSCCDDGGYRCNCESARLKREENFSGWVLEDVDTGHVWLTVGTDHGDDYYPCFTFRYSPDPSKRIEEDNDD